MAVRGGNTTAVVTLGLMLFAALSCHMVDAKKYFVGGGTNGWNFNISKWEMAREFTFKVGDELVFSYEVGKHDVVPVNANEFYFCGHAIDSKVYRSGNDTIPLIKGQNYFLCDFPNHCESGLKLRVFAD